MTQAMKHSNRGREGCTDYFKTFSSDFENLSGHSGGSGPLDLLASQWLHPWLRSLVILQVAAVMIVTAQVAPYAALSNMSFIGPGPNRLCLGPSQMAPRLAQHTDTQITLRLR